MAVDARMDVNTRMKVRCDMKVDAEAKIRWDKEQAKWAARQAEWDARRAKWSANGAQSSEQPVHRDKSQEEWQQIGKLAVSALTLAGVLGAAGLNRLHQRAQSEQADPPENASAWQTSSRPATPAIVGVLLVLMGLLWFLLSSGFGLLGIVFLGLMLITVLAGVSSTAHHRGEQQASTSTRRATAAPRKQEKTAGRATAAAATAAQTEQRAAAPPTAAQPNAEQRAPAASPPPSVPQQAPAEAASPFAETLRSMLQPKPTEAKRDPSYYRRRAKDYRQRIQGVLKSRRRGPLTDAVASAAQNAQRWEERVGQLTDRLITFEKDAIIQRDIREVPGAITRLRKASETEADPEIRQQMARTLSGLEAQQGLLDTLKRLMRRTRLQLDDTLAAMGTIYSQVQVLDAMEITGPKTTRIAEEIDEQVNRLNDLLSALGDAYAGADPSDTLEQDARRARLSQSQAAS